MVFFFFFFSSRRRHTRSLRDWSSDVCSSDLALEKTPREPFVPRPFLESAWENVELPIDCGQTLTRPRSEERRVGKSVDRGGRRNIKKKKRAEERRPYQVYTTTRTGSFPDV